MGPREEERGMIVENNNVQLEGKRDKVTEEEERKQQEERTTES